MMMVNDCLHNMKLSPGFLNKQFCFTYTMKKGSKITCKEMTPKVEEDGKHLTFENCAETAWGFILGIEMKILVMKETAQAAMTASKLKMTSLHGYWVTFKMIL